MDNLRIDHTNLIRDIKSLNISGKTNICLLLSIRPKKKHDID